MNGSRPLLDSEIEAVLTNLGNIRDQTLCVLGLRAGFRISELLSLTIANVMQYDVVANQVTVTRKNMKGKISSRTVPLHPQGKKFLELYIPTLKNITPETKLFDFKRQRAHVILKTAFNQAKLEGKVSSHSLRKFFANKVHKALGENIFKTQKALGHSNINSTIHYLSYQQAEIDSAITGV